MEQVNFRVDEDVLSDVDEIAHARSEPGNRVTRSDIIREALDKYLEKSETHADTQPNPA
jgi:metal-responsive CopG/Arc/MetJ family transcriptional regulator